MPVLIFAIQVFAGSLNSEVRRRQSTDFLSPLPTPAVTGERSRLNSNTSAVSPLRERFGSLIRRKDGMGNGPNLNYNIFRLIATPLRSTFTYDTKKIVLIIWFRSRAISSRE